jgi:hypothetical protein
MNSVMDPFVEQIAQLTLQRVDPSFINSVTGSVCRAKCSNILQERKSRVENDLDIRILLETFSTLPYYIHYRGQVQNLETFFVHQVKSFQFFEKLRTFWSINSNF